MEYFFIKSMKNEKSHWPSLNQSFAKQANENEIPLLHESNGNASESGTSLEVSLCFLMKSLINSLSTFHLCGLYKYIFNTALFV